MYVGCRHVKQERKKEDGETGCLFEAPKTMKNLYMFIILHY